MPLYHVAITHNNERAVIAVDHVLEEYGISEQEFVSTWFLDRPEIQGDGDTFEEAFERLFKNYALQEDREKHLLPPILIMRHEFAKATKASKNKFVTPIIGEVNG